MIRQGILAILVLTTAVSWSGCGSQHAAQSAEATGEAPKTVAVRTVAAELRQVDRTISVTGSLQADESVNVTPEVPGRLSQIYADFGSTVKKGQLLAQIDPEEFNLQLERTKAALTQALARLGLPPDATAKPETTPALQQAKAHLEDAKFKYESAQRLVKTGDISQDRYNETEKAYNAAQAAHDAALYDMRVQAANVDALRAEVKLAEKRLRDTSIRAPFDGRVSERQASPGQYVKDANTIVSLVKTWPLRLRAEIPEAAIAGVQVGSRLSFSTDAAPGSFEAQVTEINPSLDSRSRTLTVEAKLTKSDPRLKPGMFVQVELVTARNQEIVTVPKSAIYTVAGLSKLFVIQNGKAHQRLLADGMAGDSWVEVPKSDVPPGTSVAIDNLDVLVDGLAVQERRADSMRSHLLPVPNTAGSNSRG